MNRQATKIRKPKYVPVKTTGRIDGIPVRPFVTGLARRIEAFWNRYDDEGVKRTIKIDECDRRRVARDLANFLRDLDRFEARSRKSNLLVK